MSNADATHQSGVRPPTPWAWLGDTNRPSFRLAIGAWAVIGLPIAFALFSQVIASLGLAYRLGEVMFLIFWGGAYLGLIASGVFAVVVSMQGLGQFQWITAVIYCVTMAYFLLWIGLMVSCWDGDCF